MQEIFSNTMLTVNQLIEKIDTGELGLPELQRPFIWKDSKVRDLFDSMMRGYPIGYLMLWECPAMDKKKTIGVDVHSYDSPKEVIIDGQQRLTSLYAVMKGKKVINSKFDEKPIVISYRPLKNKFEVGYPTTKKDPEWIYNISELYTSTNSYKLARTINRGNGLLLDYDYTRKTAFSALDRSKQSDEEESESSFLIWLYNYRRENDLMGGGVYTQHRVLWRLWDWEEKNGDVSLDVFPGFTYDSKTNGYAKTSFLWRFFRYENDPADGKKVDLFFIPLWR